MFLPVKIFINLPSCSWRVMEFIYALYDAGFIYNMGQSSVFRLKR